MPWRASFATGLACGALLLASPSLATPQTSTRGCPIVYSPDGRLGEPSLAPRCRGGARGTWSGYECDGAPVSDC